MRAWSPPALSLKSRKTRLDELPFLTFLASTRLAYRMGKKQQVKSVPRTTTITPASTSTVLTAFSPSSDAFKSSLYYAHLLRAPDAHTLRIYESATGKCISRWASNALGDDEDQEQRVASFEWTLIPAPAATETAEQPAEAEGKRGKKRRKSDSTPTAAAGAADEAARQQQPKLVLALGLENGSILLWSPNGATPSTLSHSSSSSPVTALASPVGEGSAGHLWSAHEDGAVRVWDLVSGQLVGKTSGIAETKKWDDLAVRYEAGSDKKRSVQLVLSHLSLHVYSLSIGGASKKDKVKDLKTTEIGRCTGHVEAGFVRWTGRSAASPSTSAMEDDSTSDFLSFLSYSPADRFVQFWTLPLSSSSTRAEGALAARLALDSGVQTVSLGSSSVEEEQIIAAIDSVGNSALARLPFTIPQPATKGKKAAGVVALEVESEISGRGGKGAGVSEIAFGGAEGQIVVCRGGVKPVFESVVSPSFSSVPNFQR